MNSTGMTEFTPLVHDGIMFLWNYGELIQALDARNGNLLWRYRQTIPADYSRDIFYRTKRSLAIGGNKLIVPTTDMHLIALDIKTGEVVWDVVTDDYKKSKRVYNGGPLVVKDKVIMGASGCAPGGVSCFITGHDLATGKELWRFNTVAQPGEPGNETWNGVPPEKRWGASVWIPPSYDPELNLVYIAVGSPFPWSSVDRGTYNPKGGGKNGDSLYTNSTLAINPDTGKLVWHYQHLPNDTFDQDYAFERVIAPVQWRAGKRKAVITAGKPGGHRSARRRDRPVPVRQGSRRAEHLHLQRGDRRQDADGARAARRHPALPEQQRRPELPGRVLRPQHQPLLPVDQRRLHAARPASCRTGWSASTSTPASSPWTSSRG